MNSNNKAVVEKNNQKYTPIEPASNGRRFLWAICGVLAATVIIGAVISGNMSSTTSVSKFNEVSTEFSPDGYLKKTTGPVKPVIDGEDTISVSPSIIVVDTPTASNSKKSVKKSVRKDDPVDVGSVSPSVIVVDAPTTSNAKKSSAKKSSAKKSVRKDDPVPENDDSIPPQTDDQTTEPSKAPSDSSVKGPSVEDEPSASPNGQSVEGPNVDEPSASPNGQSVKGPSVEDEPSASPNGQSVKGPSVEDEPSASPNGQSVKGPGVEDEPSASPNGQSVKRPGVEDEPSASPNSQGAKGPNDIFGATLNKATVAAKTAAKETKPGGSKKDKNPKSKSNLRQ